MKRKLLLLGLLPFLLFSCAKDEISPSPLIDGYESNYMVNMSKGGHEHMYHSYSLQYDKSGRVTRRGWKVICLMSVCEPFESGFYDTVMYQSNTVRLLSLSRHPELSVDPNETLIKLYRPNQPEYRVRRLRESANRDSVRYYYSAKGKLDSLTQYIVFPSGNRRKENTKRFSFDAHGNLSEVETSNYLSSGIVIDVYSNLFEDYDTAPNPLQPLYMFNDTFYRSLSKNNFRSHQTKYFSVYYNTTSFSHKYAWHLEYDERGIPLFMK